MACSTSAGEHGSGLDDDEEKFWPGFRPRRSDLSRGGGGSARSVSYRNPRKMLAIRNSGGSWIWERSRSSIHFSTAIPLRPVFRLRALASSSLAWSFARTMEANKRVHMCTCYCKGVWSLCVAGYRITHRRRSTSLDNVPATAEEQSLDVSAEGGNAGQAASRIQIRRREA